MSLVYMFALHQPDFMMTCCKDNLLLVTLLVKDWDITGNTEKIIELIKSTDILQPRFYLSYIIKVMPILFTALINIYIYILRT